MRFDPFRKLDSTAQILSNRAAPPGATVESRG
jgi:hypothetical protein